MVEGETCVATVHCGQSGGGSGGRAVPDVVVSSFGYLHGGPPAGAAVVVDVRVVLRDPHVDPGFGELTGRDPAVVARMLATPGARGLVDGVVRSAAALLAAPRGGVGPVRIAFGCAGGRHRSVVLADAVADSLTAGGWWVVVTEHPHLDRGVAGDGGVS